ncbi:hypothetical protein [Corallococcus sicarius]|uniref:Porin n=1 Tax=Corallococcus sicarius TaxID=2316726 RepID=A0A3A8NCA0_9BACT|nr:hypothetical protein [Corallococcus sicarius]RKH41987.1 hypothetical protein D7X12_16965 [Corallococcus sicarius]
MFHLRWLSLCLGVLLLSGPASGMPLADGKFFIHGYGHLSTGRTWENVYLGSNDELGQHDVGSTLMFRALPVQRLVVNTQFSFEKEPGESLELEVDYAFAEYAFSDKLRLRVGRNQLPLALYSEIYDVGTLRPFTALPQGTYGPTSIGAENYDGLGLTGRFNLPAEWMLEYDAYGGFLDQKDALAMDCEDSVGGVCVVESQMAGGRLALWAPLEGLRFTTSGFVSRIPEKSEEGEHDVLGVLGVGAEYLGESLWLRAEFFNLFSDAAKTRTAYLEAAYFLTPHWQVSGRLEGSRSWSPTPIPAALLTYLRHREVAVGLNYWFNPHLVFKVSFHNVNGNRFAQPEPSDDPTAFLRPETHTKLLSLGTQFSF